MLGTEEMTTSGGRSHRVGDCLQLTQAREWASVGALGGPERGLLLEREVLGLFVRDFQ